MFLKIGHRGARAYEVENTLVSFKKAIALGANAIEFDVRKSRDGELVVIHDEGLKKIFGVDVNVNEATLRELKELSEDRIPTAGEALKCIGKRVEKILVELKESGCERNVLKSIKRERVHDRVIIVSFLEQELLNVRTEDSDIETGLIYSRYRNPVDAARRLKAQYLVPLYRLVHTRNIEDAHKNGLKVLVWTINTREEFEMYREKGVDGIASDRPDIFQAPQLRRRK